jgi:hypothetical protein
LDYFPILFQLNNHSTRAKNIKYLIKNKILIDKKKIFVLIFKKKNYFKNFFKKKMNKNLKKKKIMER